jgi:hypothetical protein
MKRLLLITFLLLGLAGCSAFKETTSTAPNRTGKSPKLSRSEASQKLSSALQELEQGRQTAAMVILEEIVAGSSVKGVTDEALFRLSVLKLLNAEKDESDSSIRYLERLRREYRDSAWAMQAKPLLAYLYAAADMNNQNRNLRAHNSSLSKENKELHKSLNRLKSLEVQMERNSR